MVPVSHEFAFRVNILHINTQFLSLWFDSHKPGVDTAMLSCVMNINSEKKKTCMITILVDFIISVLPGFISPKLNHQDYTANTRPTGQIVVSLDGVRMLDGMFFYYYFYNILCIFYIECCAEAWDVRKKDVSV